MMPYRSCFILVSAWLFWGGSNLQLQAAIETVQVLQDFSAPASAESWLQSANMSVTHEAGENPALRISIEMSNRINGWCQINFPQPLDTSRANAIRFRWKGDGTGTKLKHWVSVTMPDGSSRNYARVLDDCRNSSSSLALCPEKKNMENVLLESGRFPN